MRAEKAKYKMARTRYDRVVVARHAPKCPRCHFGGYRQEEAWDGRPSFVCTRCDHTWTCGKDGGEYAAHANCN